MNTENPFQYLMPTYAAPVVTFKSGKGARLTDTENNEYLDFLAGLAVVSLGHAHPEIAKALAAQSKELLHTSNLYGNLIAGELAKTLDELLGGGGLVFFANSGAEANEAAIKLARKHGGYGKHKIVSAYRSFHGRTLASLAATGQPEKQEPFAPMPEGFKLVEYGSAAAIESQMDEATAGVLLEAIQGEGGVVPAPEGYLKEVRELCTARGILLIIDEVQTGLGRTGDWFAFQYEGIQPDVVTMAKALGNGVPIGACWAKREIAEVFEPGDHATTFGGQALASAAALKTLEVLKEIDAPKRATELGGHLADELTELQHIKEVRGRGLMLAAELSDEFAKKQVAAKEIAAQCLEKGLVVNAVTPTAIRFTPPLIIEKKDIKEAVGIFDSVLEQAITEAKEKQKAGIGK